MRTEEYVYKNCPIPGGGYVTGFVFHEKNPEVFYCRTDIGGTYRFDANNNRWESLIKHVTMENPEETFPIALALDPEDANMLYIACGVNRVPNGKMAVSHDRGNSFSYYNVPVMIHGNLNGRGTGFRLIVDKNDSNRLLFANQQEGLIVSADRGQSWTKISSFPEEYMTFVGQSGDGDILFAAGAGVTTAVNDQLRGHSLYASKDNGETFCKLAGPADTEIDGVAFAGHVAQRYSADDKYLYVTFSVMGRNAYVHENGYSCDGGSVIGGRIYRYSWDDIKKSYPVDGYWDCTGEDITPDSEAENLLEYGFSGICASAKHPGLLISSTICKGDGDCIYRSFDYGNTWECVLFGLEIGKMDFRTSYMKPEHNGNGNLIHWLTDVKINPFNENEAWFNTGTGVFVTKNLLGDEVVFSDWSDGIEETVHLNIYSPPSGDVKLIDILGDLGGFAFTDLDEQCTNSFADADGNRYITCINADYSDKHPESVVVTPRGNWTGKTKGGLILSDDQCKTFRRIELPYGLTEELDAAFHAIETPNVNSGWVAMSADADTVVWSVADGINLPVSRVIVSHDRGYSFDLVKVYDKADNIVTEGGFKVFADRINPNMFVGFGEHSDVYVSMDSGDSFHEISIDNPFGGEVDFTLIDCADKTEIRANSGKSGCFYMALGKKGLWKLSIESDAWGKACKLSNEGDSFYRLGLGVIEPGGNYFDEAKALYTVAAIDGEYGFYRSVNEGVEWVRINSDMQMFGDINSVEGDSRVFGRFFIATGSLGVIYGEPV